MSSLGITPRLEVSVTINHPLDEGRVVGFYGRDTKYGQDCLVLKGDELPVRRDGPGVTHFIVPESVRELAEDGDLPTYILDEHEVYRADPMLYEKAMAHTGRKYGKNLTGRPLAVRDMHSWSAQAVEVTN